MIQMKMLQSVWELPLMLDLGSPSSFTLVIEDNELPPCDVGIHLLTIGTDSINLSVVNEGEDVIYTGGSVSWNETTFLTNQG